MTAWVSLADIPCWIPHPIKNKTTHPHLQFFPPILSPPISQTIQPTKLADPHTFFETFPPF